MDNIKRGEMFYISRGGASYSGSEQHSDRPAVVVSNNKNNENSNVVEIVYMTTQPKTDLPTHVTVRSTVNKGIAEKKEYKKPEIKAKTTAEQFVEAVMQTGVTAEQVKTAIMKMSGSQGCTNRRNTNNWRKMHGLPMRRKQKARRKHERGKGADSH